MRTIYITARESECHSFDRLLLDSVYQPGIARPEINKETLFECSSPRKSLVKGERFVRSEEKPELLFVLFFR